MYSKENSLFKMMKSRTLFTANLAHMLHDGFTDMLYIFFPIWQIQFSLSYMEVGLFKALSSGIMALFQIPASWLAGKIGKVHLLIFGTLLTSSAICFWGWADSSLLLGCFLILGGLGSSVQHPLSSTLISNACPDSEARRMALSCFNMAGDFGKLLLPTMAALIIRFSNWEFSSLSMGMFGFLMAGVLFLLRREYQSEIVQAVGDLQKSRASFVWNRKYSSFWALVFIGIIDSGTRMGFLTFFPFLLKAHDADVTITALALSLVFAGGAFGKLACGFLSTHWGSKKTVLFTEIATSCLILGIMVMPLSLEIVLSFFLGIVLNGTSSVIYGTVPDLVSKTDCQQAFAIFYTATIASGALSPWIYGTISDTLGIQQTITIIAICVWMIVPVVLAYRL